MESRNAQNTEKGRVAQSTPSVLSSTKALTLFGFFAITASMLMSADEYPAFALSGLHAIFYLVAGGLLWFLPVALCSAELASVESWEEGGVFGWVENTLGQRLGFVAIFFQWLQITVGFVTMIYFVLGALSYLFSAPELNSNPLYKLIGFIVLYWLVTLFQLLGIGKTANLVKICFVVGILIPAAAQIFLALRYVLVGNPIQIPLSARTLIPNLSDFSALVAFLPFILAYTGIEASASHVNEMKNPKRDYPLTLLLLVFFAIFLDSTGGLSVAAVVPRSQLSLNAGLIQSLQTMLAQFSFDSGWLVKLLAGLMALGMLGEISSWVVGPVRGLHVTAKLGILPYYFTKLNKDGVPVRLVVVQGIIVSIVGAAITLIAGGANSSYALAISLTVMIYLVVYILIFVAYLVLLFKYPSKPRAFNIPGGRYAKTAVAGVGIVLSFLAFALTFVPTSKAYVHTPVTYALVLGCGLAVALSIPLAIYQTAEKKGRMVEGGEIKQHLRAADINRWTPPRARGEHHLLPVSWGQTGEGSSGSGTEREPQKRRDTPEVHG